MDKSTNILSNQLENLSLNISNISSLSFNRSMKNVKTPIKSLKLTNAQTSYTPGSGRKTPNRQQHHHHGKENKKSSNKNGNKISPKTPINGDRFIPDRSAMNFEIIHYLVTNHDDNSNNSNNVPGDNSTKQMDKIIGADLANYRILALNNGGPKPPEGYLNDKKVVYSCTKSSSKTKSARYISKQPERILDAPDVLNDYYLQLIDWNSSNILAVALNNEVYLWNAMDGSIVHLLALDEPDYISSLSWVNNNDTHLAVGLSTGVTQIWDVNKSQRLRNLTNSSSRVSCMSWNNHVLSNGTKDGEIFNHDVRIATSRIGTFRAHTLEICGLKWSPNGQLLASGGNDNIVNIWPNCFMGQNNSDTTNDSEQPLFQIIQHQAAVKALSWCPWRNNCLASGGGTNDRMIRIWNTSNGQCMYSVDTRSQVSAILWSEQYRELISSHGFANNELIIWKYPQFTRVTELLGHTARVLCMAMSADGSTVVSLGADETLRFWDCFQSDSVKKKRQKNTKKLTDFQQQENIMSNVSAFHIR
ncbi:cell division cycle protein 20 homolog [Dermatophagoides farinae]|uniref:Wd domain containing protein n=1 Tax=Dermatophagoides farinae TaxID=6954 RepID=A0A9D4SFB5_DERFA|nr:cell division cycle protein 20 homolog [Dermatophagoides farinae]KAH7639621.1 wd domain containing protein [Dermatophagoides farinae]